MSPPSRILVADDEAAILEIYEDALLDDPDDDAETAALDDLEEALFGGSPQHPTGVRFELVTCRQGDEAVEAVARSQRDGRPFCVAFLDMRMPPGMDGLETAERIRELDPEINIAIVTGFSDAPFETIRKRVPPADRIFFFVKPFQLIELNQFATALCTKLRSERALKAAHDRLEVVVEQRTAELRHAKEVAECADRAKTHFLANVGHELRTPLNAIIGFSKLIADQQKGALGDPSYVEFAREIQSSGQHLLRLINDVLGFATAESGKLKLREGRVDLGGLLKDTLSQMGLQAQEAGVILNSDLPDDLPEVCGDEVKLRQICLNVISNAIKFTEPGGSVLVSAAGDARRGMTVSVKDTGIGIAPEDIEKALSPFCQIDSDLSRKYSGTGLGLPLAVVMAELHDGRLTLDSTQGRGTEVKLHLPPARTVAEDPAEPRACALA